LVDVLLLWTNAEAALGVCGRDGGWATAPSSSQRRTTTAGLSTPIRYDESMGNVLEELEGEAAEAAYGKRRSDEMDPPAEPGAD
jgi:hypothetical protein